MQVEIAQAFRLSNNQIDVIGFTVPRAKVRHPTRAHARRLVLTSGCVCVLDRPVGHQPAYFQEDLYPPTRLFDKPAMTAQEWRAGALKQLERKSLHPEGMKPRTTRFRSAP